jgi:peptide/nickel transport system substrate-binding protein
LLLVLTACSSGSEETTTTSEAPSDTTTTTTTVAPGDTTTTTAAPEPSALAIGMGNLPPSGVPWTGAGSPGQYVWGQVFDALTFIEPDGSVGPGLAESWTAVDETTWDFTIRSGVEFQNGEPLDAEAVVATFATLLSEEGRATFSANVNNYGFIDSVEAVDSSTVRMATSTPQVLLPSAISLAYIAPPAYYAEVGAEGFATAPVGTGPYMATSWGDQEITLEAWEGSWRNDPSIPAITFLNLNDPAARVQALQSGQIGLAQSVSPDQLAPLQGEGFTIFSGGRGSVLSLALIANEDGPLASQEVRQALNYALDTQAIVDALLQGLAAPGVWPSPGVNGYDPARDPYPYDPDLARELLADAGYGDGFDLVAEITVGAFPADADIYEAMQGYLADIGVNIELRQIDFAGEWLPKFLGTDGADWEGDAFGLSWNAAPFMDGVRPFNFFSCGHANEFFCDEEAEAMITEVNATFDVDERNTLLTELLEHTKENPPAIWLSETIELWAHVSELSGFSVDNFNIKFEDVSLG